MAALTSLEAVKEWLSIEPDNTTQDALLTKILDAVSGMVVRHLGHPVIESTLEELRDGNGKPELYLKGFPVSSIESLHFSGQSIPEATGDGKTAPWQNGYVLSPFFGMNQRVILYGKMFPRERNSVSVSYVCGYAEDAIPEDIQQAVWETVAARYRYLDRIGYTSKSLGGQETVSFAPNKLDDYVVSLLSPHKSVIPL